MPIRTNAQQLYVWSPPRQIPEYYNFTDAPFLVADTEGTVHAFDLETSPSGQFAIYHRTWSISDEWSTPTDIILPEYSGVAPKLLDAILDGDGYFHIIYFAGTQQQGTIFHSTAFHAEVGIASGWTRPNPISVDAGPLPAGQIIEAREDVFVTIFSGSRSGSGLYQVNSTDGGSTWSTPALIHRSKNESVNDGGIRLAMDSHGDIHAVWHVDNVSGLAEETWYGHLDRDLSTWRFIQMLSQKDNELEFNGEPSIIIDNDIPFVVYYDGFPPTRFFRHSVNGGKTWSTPIRPFPHTGGGGHASLVKDGKGVVHMVLGNRLQNPEIHGMWYTRLIENQWLPLEPITSGPGTDSYGPTKPMAVVVLGNILLATWSNDVRLEFRTPAWYSFTLLDAPENEVEPLPEEPQGDSLPIDDQPTPVQQVIPDVRPVPVNVRSDDEGDMFSLADNPGLAVFLGVIPALILVVVAIVKRLNQS
jgi:hypothetical protein